MNLSWQTDEQGVGGVDDLSAIISNDKSSSLSSSSSSSEAEDDILGLLFV